VVHINAVPETYIKFVNDFNRLRHVPFPQYFYLNHFSNPPLLSDLQDFGFPSYDVQDLKNCKPGECRIQLPASNAMDELRKSVNWSAPNVDEQVNQLVRKLALSRLVQYQGEGDRIFGDVYNEKGQQVNVSDQFKYILSYYQAMPRELPDFYKYILSYPVTKPANVQDSFFWDYVGFGLKPTLRIVHVLTMHGDKPDDPAYVIAQKQLYASHYLETSLDMTYLIRGSDDPKQPGFYLVQTMGCEQGFLTGFKGAMIRKMAVDRSVGDLQKSLAYVKQVLETQK
jgi:hypothetical protein